MRRNSTLHVCLNALSAVTVLSGAAIDAQAREQQLVLVYDTAQIAAEVMSEAQNEASRIFREAVMELRWMNCRVAGEGEDEVDTCAGQHGGAALYVHISPSAGNFPNQHALAHAAVGAGGVRAAIFFDRVRALAAKGTPCDLARLLGHVMAHEMGHLLLTQAGHSPQGLMAGPWSAQDLRQAAAGRLLFTPAEGAKMRNEMVSRARRYAAAK
ncbi:MAG: hypothetical protein JST11_31655 [Acidobacteria bacterium]|nr:hypothetical protein [Acidobacteriota bacterium]